MSVWIMQRELVPERMDDPALPEAEHRRALRGLRRINRISGVGRSLARAVQRAAGSGAPETTEPMTVLDLACGGGENAVALARYAAARGLDWRVVGMDASPTAVAAAREHAASVDVAVEFRVGDAFNDPWPDGPDVVVSSLFLHHLTRAEAVNLIRKMIQQADKALVINDLVRCRAGWLAAWTGTRLLTRSTVVHFDGPQSVRAAWTERELRQLAREAGLAEDRIHLERAWPFRMTLIGGLR